mmetsp:Transcript_84654/g.229405  ORF Transcript_84654/g.229405 Transcript_84654/m.229405 type:complete len:209 (-) Transcript_84654:770-1396(-)
MPPSEQRTLKTFSATSVGIPKLRKKIFSSLSCTVPSLLRSMARKASWTVLYFVVSRSWMAMAMSLISFSSRLSSNSISGFRLAHRKCGPSTESKWLMKAQKSTSPCDSSASRSNILSETWSEWPKPRKNARSSCRVMRPLRCRSNMRNASRGCLNLRGSFWPRSCMRAFSSALRPWSAPCLLFIGLAGDAASSSLNPVGMVRLRAPLA